MPLLEYQEGNTLMHRMSPVAKFAWGGIVLVWVFLMFSPIPVLILGIVIFLIAKFAAGLSLRRLLITCLKVGVLGVFILVFQGLLYPGQTVLFELGPLRPTLEGVSVGLAIALRVIAIVSASTVISKTTDPRDIFLSLVKLGVPYKIAYGLFAALRFIPLMEYEAETIQEAQRVRGIVTEHAGPVEWVKQSASLLVPLIASAVRRAMQTGAAWEVRGFGMHPTRTYCRKTRSSRADPIFVSIWAIALIAYVLLMDQNVLSAITFQPPK